MRKPPALRQHPNGQYIIKWGGRVRYLGADKKEAQAKYLAQLEEWGRWQEAKAVASSSRGQARITIAKLVDDFVFAKEREHGVECGKRYAKHLKRFVATYGRFDADLIGPTHLNRVKMDCLAGGLANRTINHDLITIKVMFTWAQGLGIVPPVSFKGVKNLPLGPTPDYAVTVQRVKDALEKAPERLKPYIAINYLGLLRPSEVVRVARREFTPHKDIEKVIVLDRGKMDKRAAIKRHCIFSDEAWDWLGQMNDAYTRLDSYSAACRNLAGIAPKVLQKSGAAHLVQHHGASPADVELLLGHVTSRLSVTYYHPAFQRLRGVVSVLSLR